MPILLISQLGRDSENKGRPQISHLKESGSTEEKSGVVILLHRPDRHKPEAELILAKNRYGDTGFMNLFFEKDCVRFVPRIADAYEKPQNEKRRYAEYDD